MKYVWLHKIRTLFAIKSFSKSIRDHINWMARERQASDRYALENKRMIVEKIIMLIDLCQEFLHPQASPPELTDYEKLSPEEVNLSLPELLVLFRKTLQQLQGMPLKVRENALDILYSYFIELQGLYDLVFISHNRNTSLLPLSLASVEDHQKRYLRLAEEVEDDPLIHEYRSIDYNFLMKVSVIHHLHVIFFDILPKLAWTAFFEFIQGKKRCRNHLDPESVRSVDELRTLLQAHPLSESAKLSVALHRHTMRIFDILFTRITLRLGRPMFELLILAIWSQTVKDHIVPGIHRPDWQAEHLEVSQTPGEPPKNSGKIKMSSAFFMQPRITFQLERFLIFKIRTMTVGDVVRTTELGNWMRKNSPDEFLQFFNIALGDMGGLGIRTMPEHEILASKDTQWLAAALMSFIPGGLTSPGSIVMRNTNYGLTKAEQLFREIVFYDPRFKGSSGFWTDAKILLHSLMVLSKGRTGDSLKKTESFVGDKHNKRGY